MSGCGFAQSIHRLWAWCLTDPTLMSTVLSVLQTYTAHCIQSESPVLYKYLIMSYQWYESYYSVHHSIMDYISLNCTDHNYGIMIIDLCYYRDVCDPHVLTATDIVQIIEYLCTI